MQVSESTPENWETQAEVNQCLLQTGVSASKMARWRHEGLLPGVSQIPKTYHGSEVLYPAGTCRQIAAAARLFNVKSSVAYVGWQLWWEGYPVHERYWRPRLEKRARDIDKGLGLIRKYSVRDELQLHKKTLQERVADSSATNIVMSRIRGRQADEALSTTLATLIQVAAGEFQQFSIVDGGAANIHSDEARTIEALDLDASTTDVVLDQRLKLTSALPGVLAAISRAFRSGPFTDVLTLPESEIFQARDDIRNGFRMYVAMHDTLKWIYGSAAFGLRLGAWIGKKRPDFLMPLIIIGFVRVRRMHNDLYSSEKIADMADQAELNLRLALQWWGLAARPEFKGIITPKRFRRALQNQPALNQFMKEIELARLRAQC